MDAIRLQSHAPEQWVIVDDSSTDASVRIIGDYASRWGQPEWVAQPVNLGVIRTFTKTLPQFWTDYLYPAAADDYALPGFFEKAVAAAKDYPGVGVIFGAMEVRDASNRVLTVMRGPWDRPVYLPPQRFYDEFLMRESPLRAFGCSILYRTDALKEIRLERFESMGHGYDNFLWRAIAMRYGAFYIPETLGVWCVQGGSVSQAAMRDRLAAEFVMNETLRWMKSQEFAPLFPEPYARAWEAGYRKFLNFYFHPILRPLADGAFVIAGNPFLRPAVQWAEDWFRKSFLNLSSQSTS